MHYVLIEAAAFGLLKHKVVCHEEAVIAVAKNEPDYSLERALKVLNYAKPGDILTADWGAGYVVVQDGDSPAGPTSDERSES